MSGAANSVGGLMSARKTTEASVPSALHWTVLFAAMAIGACSGQPPAPDWQMNAQDAMERATQAYLSGDARLEMLEFAKARSEVAKTGRADLLARAELVRCATRVASLVLEDCSGFDALAQDAAAPEQAYANYLGGRADAQDAALLPPQHRATALTGSQAVDLKAVADPLARLVAAGVLMRTGRADPVVIALAIDTASAQGWRRPLLAWLGVQARRAEQAGDNAEAARIRRRIALAGDAPARAP